MKYSPSGGKQVLGVTSFHYNTLVDKEARTVYFRDVEFPSARFPLSQREFMAGSGLSIGLSGNLALDIHKLDCFARNESMEVCRARRAAFPASGTAGFSSK